jgi:TonB family protein
MGRASVTGSLDKELIRRIIRRHINEVRYCYEKELGSQPKLAGKVELRFTIETDGQVVTAQVASSTLGHREAEACIARAVRRWRFPKSAGGGLSVVNYPFVFKPAPPAGGRP